MSLTYIEWMRYKNKKIIDFYIPTLSQLAPASSKTWTVSRYPLRQAYMSGVVPNLSPWFTLAPFCNSWLTIAVKLRPLAQISGVILYDPETFTLAPRSVRSCTVLSWPRYAAHNSGVNSPYEKIYKYYSELFHKGRTLPWVWYLLISSKHIVFCFAPKHNKEVSCDFSGQKLLKVLRNNALFTWKSVRVDTSSKIRTRSLN